jgi:uncharacterized protein (DUF1800 family)
MAVPTRVQLAHLLRRATFGPRAEEVDAAEQIGLDATLTGLLAPTAPDTGATRTPMPHFPTDPLAALGRGADRAARQRAQQALRQQVEASVAWWLDRLVAADRQFAEKLVFFWHGHWATSVAKVRSAVAMLRQQQTFRDLGTGDFGPFLKAMLRDPALIFWLDGQQNVRTAPNENLARESMELFTLGVGGGYTEADVRAAARALTGWQLRRGDPVATVNPGRHDDGVKTILGQTGRYDTDGYADLLLAAPAHPGFLAGRLWYRFGSDAPVPVDTRARLVAAYQPGRNVTDLVRALFTDPAFAATRGQLVKQPVEWAVGAMRQLGIRPSALPADARRQLIGGIGALGQTLFRPPSVGGWPGGAAWLTTSATEDRVRMGAFLAQHASPAVVDRLAVLPASGRIDELARLLVVDGFTDRTRAVLAGAGTDPRALLGLGLASPEYTVC